MSQVDLAILGLVNLDYTSRFLGYHVYNMRPRNEQAFIRTYQDMGHIKDGKMAILSPRQKAQMFKPDFITGSNVQIIS